MGTRIFISIAETSADVYAAGLIEAYRRRDAGAEFFGLTGPLSRAAGAATFFDLTAHASMLFGSIAKIPRVMLMLRRLRRELAANRPCAAVLVDSPALNLRIATMCKSLGIPVLYYVAPQVWAWHESRVERIRRDIDRLCAILPFEEAYFARHNIRATFVGHPLFERIEATPPDAERVRMYRSRGKPVVALMPGSRQQVIREVFPGQLEVAGTILKKYPDAVFVVVAASANAEDLARTIARRLGSGAPAAERLVFDHRYRDEMLLAADIALVASGTATLNVAYRTTSMVVMYNHGRVMYPLIRGVFGMLGKRFIRTPYLSLPNIVAEREIVPEFMPYYTSTKPIADAALRLLDDEWLRDKQATELAELTASLVRPGVAERVAEILQEMIRSVGSTL